MCYSSLEKSHFKNYVQLYIVKNKKYRNGHETNNSKIDWFLIHQM
jgi:hypothetical protein